MKERILLAPGVNESELIRSMAMRGVNSFNLRVMNAVELARLALLRSGIVVKEEFLPQSEETVLVAKAYRDSKLTYFGSAPSFQDFRNLAESIRKMRSFVTDRDERTAIRTALSKGIFKEKNKELLKLYEAYLDLLRKDGLMDGISLVRNALFNAAPFNSDYEAIKERPLSPLEEALIRHLSSDSYLTVSLKTLFKAEESIPRFGEILQCFGDANETEKIISDIYSGIYPLDQYTVAVTDANAYGQLFFDEAVLHNIPITFSFGISVTNSNAYKLFEQYSVWAADGFYQAENLKNLLTSEAFDYGKFEDKIRVEGTEVYKTELIKAIGQVRLTDRPSVNKDRMDRYTDALQKDLSECSDDEKKKHIQRSIDLIPILRNAATELERFPDDFIKEYARIRRPVSKDNDDKGSKKALSPVETMLMALDAASKEAIIEEISILNRAGFNGLRAILQRVAMLSVCAEGRKPGYLHVSDVSGAMLALRENLFVAGLSASNYPGTPRENSILLDNDMECFGPAAKQYQSDAVIEEKKQRLYDLVSVASGIGNSITLSYSRFDVSELKDENISSVVLELYQRANGPCTLADMLKTAKKVDYFEPNLSMTASIGRKYNEEAEIETNESRQPKDPGSAWDRNREFSPSSIENYIACPKQFLLKNLLRIEEPEEDKPLQVISAKNYGLLVHRLMECITDGSIALNEFLDLADEYFDRFMAENPASVSGDIVQTEKQRFRKQMEHVFEEDPMKQDSGITAFIKETKLHGVHLETGLKLQGIPDRIEKRPNGEYVIADFKTGKDPKKHNATKQGLKKNGSVHYYAQAIVYAYLLESLYGINPYAISGEYRYLKLGRVFPAVYGAEVKNELEEALKKFIDDLNTNHFPIREGTSSAAPCSFCKFMTVCGKAAEARKEED